MSDTTTEGKDPHDSGSTDTTTDSDTDTDAPVAFVETRVMSQEATVEVDTVEGAVRIRTRTEDLTANVMYETDAARELVADLEAAIASAEGETPAYVDRPDDSGATE